MNNVFDTVKKNAISGEESAMYCRGECLRCREVRVTYGNAWIATGGAI